MATKEAMKYKDKGNKEFQKGNMVKAIEYYTYATEMDPNNPIFYTNRSTAYFKMKKYDKSLRDANKAIKKDATWDKGYYRAGMALMMLDRNKEALPRLKDALKIAKSDSKQRQNYQNAILKCKQAFMKGMSQAEILKTEANELFQKGKYDDAIQKYSRAINRAGTSDKELLVKADCYANRAACNRQLYEPVKVVSDCTEALKLNKHHVKALIRRGQGYESLEKYEKALADFQQATYLSPGASVAVMGASRIRSSLRNMEKQKGKK